MIDINQDQRRASNPYSSIWVSASAGSGKTKVLTDRILKLLLIGNSPEKLLCLTFTKAAAAEMSNRINKILKIWTVCSDEELANALLNLFSETPTSEMMKQARRLFTRVLEAPGGMKIMTIHGFSQSILSRFPLEAGISPNFEVMDELKAKSLLDGILKAFLSDNTYQSDIQILSQYLTLDNLTSLLQELLNERSRLLKLKDKGSFNTLIHQIKQQLGITEYQTEEEIISAFFPLENWDEIKAKYLTKSGEILKRKIEEPLAHQAEQVIQKIKSLTLVKLTFALLHIAFVILEEYQSQKQAQGLMDYDDLIEKTRNLFSQSHAAAWVLFKLDGGIDHILVDEAQDTNPAQWEIIRAIAEEFFTGQNAHDKIRTLFTVGDKKQSIYRFQGADPNEFERMYTFFEKKVKDSQNDFETIPLNLSFRSTKPVLELVNRLLQNPVARQGVLSPNEQAIHLSYREQDAGLVEIWPLITHQKSDKEEAWKPPVERIQNPSSLTRLAEKITDKISSMIQNKEILESQGRPVCAGDFLILVQRRNRLVNELVRLLKEHAIPVAGIDRLNLTEHIAIQDLLAAAKFALLPTDDLNLACLLKSPLIGLQEDDLFKIAYKRGKHSLWQQVQTLFPKQAEILAKILTQADKVPPFEFFAMILGPMHGRQNFISRLGNEVNEALDEFLNLVLNFEQNNIPSLQTFIDFIADKTLEIKRDMESDQNAVRIMTVHASKGLQGRIVFLPQTRFIAPKRSPFVWLNNELPLWVPTKSMATHTVEYIFNQEAQEEAKENKRLLYVALTRASDRLYICGYENAKAPAEDNWYDLIINSVSMYTKDSDGIIRIKSPQLKNINHETTIQNITKDTLPEWIYETAPIEIKSEQPLSPSKLADKESSTISSPLLEAQTKALERGQFIHSLLQYLPSIPQEKWENVIQNLKPHGIEVPENLYILFQNPQFASIFGPDSLAEVPIIGTWEGQVFSGQIDRLVILPNEVWIVDFKTNRLVPTDSTGIPVIYQKQLQTYKALISQIFPKKEIKTYLLWTENLTLMEVNV